MNQSNVVLVTNKAILFLKGVINLYPNDKSTATGAHSWFPSKYNYSEKIKDETPDYTAYSERTKKKRLNNFE